MASETGHFLTTHDSRTAAAALTTLRDAVRAFFAAEDAECPHHKGTPQADAWWAENAAAMRATEEVLRALTEGTT